MKWICTNCKTSNENTKKCKNCGSGAKILPAVQRSIAGWKDRAPTFLHKRLQNKGNIGPIGSSIAVVPRMTARTLTPDFVCLGGGGYTIAILCTEPAKYGIRLSFKNGTPYDGGVVLRIVGDTSSGRPILETPKRVAVLFNQLNDIHNIPRAKDISISKTTFETMKEILDSSHDQKWQSMRHKYETKIAFLFSAPSRDIAVMPYISGLVPANDLQLSHYVVKNFMKYHRVLLDAFNNDNVMQATPQSNFVLNPNELVTLDASAFFEVFRTEAGTTGGRRRSYPSIFWSQHQESHESKLVGGMLLRDWIPLWHEKGGHVPDTSRVVNTLLVIAYTGVNSEDLFDAFDQMGKNVDLIIKWLDTLLDDAPWETSEEGMKSFILGKIVKL